MPISSTKFHLSLKIECIFPISKKTMYIFSEIYKFLYMKKLWSDAEIRTEYENGLAPKAIAKKLKIRIEHVQRACFLTKKNRPLPKSKYHVQRRKLRPVVVPVVVKTRQQEIDDLVKQAPENVRFIVRTMIDDYFAKPTPGKFNTVISYLEKVNQLKTDEIATRLPKYERPKWLSPKQHEIADMVQEEINISLDGDRQTGKDSSVFVGKFEKLVQKQGKLYFLATKIATAREIMHKIINEDRFKYCLPWIINQFKDRIVIQTLKPGVYSEIVLIDTTEGAVKGITGDFWVDDIDSIIKNHREGVLTKLLAIIRSSPELHGVFTSNMGKGAYLALMDVFHKWEDVMIKCLSLTQSMVPHINQKTDDFLYDVMTALSGEAEAKAQLRNEYDSTGDSFDALTLIDAINSYPQFVEKIVPSLQFVKKVLAIDPSGTGNPHGWDLLGLLSNDHIMEFEGGEIGMGSVDPLTGVTWTEDEMIKFWVNRCRNYGITHVIIESNSDGGSIATTLRLIGFTVEHLNFGADSAPNSHAAYTDLARRFYDRHMIHIKTELLRNMLGRYDPKSSEKDAKGHIADCHIQGVWWLVDGLRYLQKEQQKQMKEKYAVLVPERKKVSFY